MSPKIDISCFRLSAINFDNAREVDSVKELIQSNLSDSEYCEFSNKVSDYEEGNSRIVSILIAYDNVPIAHVGYELDEQSYEAVILAPVLDKKFEHLRHFINSLIWRTMSRISKRQAWKMIHFSSTSYGDIPSIDSVEFRAIVVDVLPGSAAASLRSQIEVVHGSVEVVNVRENAFSQLVLNLP